MDAAYANIGLDANATWRDAPGDGFQKCSDKLWVKLNYLKEKKHHQVGEKGKVVTVHDVIPQSRLARYGNHSYDNDREMMYNREKCLRFSEELAAERQGEDTREPWTLPEVEQEFRRLTRNCSQPYDLYNGFKPVDCVRVEDSIQKKYPVLAKKCQPHAIDAEETLETIYLPNPFYRIDDLNQLELQMRITSTKHVWDHPLRNLMTLINTHASNHHQKRLPLFESECSAERKNLSANGSFAFPLAFPVPLTDSSTSPPPPPPPPPPLPQSSQTPFPSSLRLTESIGDLKTRRCFATSSRSSYVAEIRTDVAKKKSSANGRAVMDLPLFTRTADRRDSELPSFQVPETVLKWLQTGYPTRSKEFSAIQSLSEELRSVRFGLQSCRASSVAKERRGSPGEGCAVGAKLDFVSGTILNPYSDDSVARTEGSPAAPSSGSNSGSGSGSSSDRARFRKPKPNTCGAGVAAPNPALSGLSSSGSSGSSGSWQGQASSPWFPESLDSPCPALDDGARKPGEKADRRPILNFRRRDASDEDFSCFGEGVEKKKVFRGMASSRTFRCCAENSFEDLERQAIEQWPSEDGLDVFRFNHVQYDEVYNYESRELIIKVRMTTKFGHPHVVPLRAITTKSNYLIKTNRKSAVQILQETKAFYVKSETVLDKKQEFKPGKVSASDLPYGNLPVNDKSQKRSEKNNKLQDKLRLLLDVEPSDPNEGKRSSKGGSFHESASFGKTCRLQHKSLPDLHASPYDATSESSGSSSNAKFDGDCRSAYSSLSRTGNRTFFKTESEDLRACSLYLTKNSSPAEYRNNSRAYSSFRVTKSGEFVGCTAEDLESSYRRRSSNTSSCNRSRRNSSSKHSQSADSGRQSQGGSVGLRTGRSGLPEFSSPPPKSTWSDSGTEDDSPPLFRDVCDEEKKRPILRSKSDISYKYCVGKSHAKLLFSTPVLQSALTTTDKLETFFDHLGMDPMDFNELASGGSRTSSPVFFPSVSSVDSCVDPANWGFPEPHKAAECPSIVERNARIIKWLYNCRKFQKTTFDDHKTHFAAHSSDKS